jgi:hypothetical protein
MYEELKKKIDELLAGPLLDALKAVDCRTPEYDHGLSQAQALRAKVRLAHVSGSPEARYLVKALGSCFEVYVQLNVYRLVVIYRIPAQGTLDSAALQPRFARWALGAADAGWKIGWRDAIDAGEDARRAIEVYCYAALPVDFLQDERHQLYWTTDLAQMTRSFVLEARRAGVDLPGPHAQVPETAS